jgi:TorA maturation chaperone TorD
MTATQADTDTASTAVDLAREGTYRFLAALLSDPRHPRFTLVQVESRRAGTWLHEAAALLRGYVSDEIELGFSELPPNRFRFDRVLACLDELAGDPTAEYDRVFGLLSCRECPPYETEFQPNNEPFFRSQQMADIAGFYRAFGLLPPGSHSERPDHVCLELEFMAFLLMKARLVLAEPGDDGEDHAAVCLESSQKFFRDHLSWWLPSFAAGLRKRAESGLYAAVADALAAFLAIERARLGIEPQRCPVEPAHPEPPEDQRAGCSGCALHQA